MPNSARFTSFAGTLIVVSAGVSDCFARRSATSKISSESIKRPEGLTRDKPSDSALRRFTHADQNLFVSPWMPRPGGGVMSRASAGEIARVGVLVRIPPALRSYTAGGCHGRNDQERQRRRGGRDEEGRFPFPFRGPEEVVRRGPVLGGCSRVPHGPRSEGRADHVRGRAARRGTLGPRGVPRANRER